MQYLPYDWLDPIPTLIHRRIQEIRRQIDSTIRSAEPVESEKYAATVTVKLLRETEGEEEREIMRRNRMAIIVLR